MYSRLTRSDPPKQLWEDKTISIRTAISFPPVQCIDLKSIYFSLSVCLQPARDVCFFGLCVFSALFTMPYSAISSWWKGRLFLLVMKYEQKGYGRCCRANAFQTAAFEHDKNTFHFLDGCCNMYGPDCNVFLLTFCFYSGQVCLALSHLHGPYSYSWGFFEQMFNTYIF